MLICLCNDFTVYLYYVEVSNVYGYRKLFRSKNFEKVIFVKSNKSQLLHKMIRYFHLGVFAKMEAALFIYNIFILGDFAKMEAAYLSLFRSV